MLANAVAEQARDVIAVQHDIFHLVVSQLEFVIVPVHPPPRRRARTRAANHLRLTSGHPGRLGHVASKSTPLRRGEILSKSPFVPTGTKPRGIVPFPCTMRIKEFQILASHSAKPAAGTQSWAEYMKITNTTISTSTSIYIYIYVYIYIYIRFQKTIISKDECS